MKNNQLQNFIQKLTCIQLSDIDRSTFRNRLEDHITSNQPILSTWYSTLKQPAMVVAAFFFIFTGISIAAEGTVPGDSLYAVKVNINETVMGLTSFNSVSEAENQSRITARRIAELESLAARGSLDPQVSERLTTAISQHAELARTHIKTASEEGKTSSALSLEIELISTLNTHSDILEKIAGHNQPSSTSTVIAVEKLRRMAQSKVEHDVTTAIEKSSINSILVRTDDKKILSSAQANKLLERTAGRLDMARSDFDNNYDSFSDKAVRESLKKLLVTSANKVNSAIDAIDNNNYEIAENLLRDALIFAHEVSIVTEVYRLYDLPSEESDDDSNQLATTTNAATSSVDQQATSTKLRINNNDSVTTTASNITLISNSSSLDELVSSSSTDKILGTTSTTSKFSSTTNETESNQNIKKDWSSNSENYKQIDRVLRRVNETLSVSNSVKRSGFMSGRYSD